MVDYFKVLGLSDSASREDVKRAYRDRAKEWHPDRNHAANAGAAFILINEAYEYLIDDDRRASHRILKERAHDDALLKAREQRYREWVEKSRQQARERAADHARTSFDTFIDSKYFRAASTVNRATDYLFLGLAVIIFCVPFIVMLNPSDEVVEYNETTVISMGLTVFIGALFVVFIWRYLIRPSLNNS